LAIKSGFGLVELEVVSVEDVCEIVKSLRDG
jgi:hypothetical protein